MHYITNVRLILQYACNNAKCEVHGCGQRRYYTDDVTLCCVPVVGMVPKNGGHI